MATGLVQEQELEDQPSESLAEPAYLTRLSTLPERNDPAPGSLKPNRPEAARIDQIEHALTILASVVARLAKEAQQSRLQLRASGNDPGLQEERRVQRELARSMQVRLTHLEERVERDRAARPQLLPTPPTAEGASQLSASLTSIRSSLDALARRRQRA